MAKTTNNNTKQKKPANLPPLTKPPVWLEDYMDRLTWALKPLTDRSLDLLCKDYVEFAMKPTTLKAGSFFVERGINPCMRRTWAAAYPQFKSAYEWGKYIIGERRERAAYRNEANAGFVEKMMPFFDEDWKDMVEWRNKLKAEAEANNKANFVVLSEFDYSKMEKK